MKKILVHIAVLLTSLKIVLFSICNFLNIWNENLVPKQLGSGLLSKISQETIIFPWPNNDFPFTCLIVEIAEVDDHIKSAESKKKQLQDELDAEGDELQDTAGEDQQQEEDEEEQEEEEGLLDGLEEDGDGFLYDTGDGKEVGL